MMDVEDVEAEEGNGSRTPRCIDPRERDRIITEHLWLSEHLARRFSRRGESHEDLVQVASLALVNAVDRFDPDRGFEFATFATRTIIGELKHHFRDKGWSVRAPRRLQELYLEVNATIAELSQRLGRSPTVSELAEACGRTDGEVLEAIEAGQAYRSASLEAPGPDGDALVDRLGTADDSLDHVELRAELIPHLEALTPRERSILRLRFAEELTQSEIGERMGLSQMHVSRLLRGALEKLREAYRADEAP